MQDIFEFPNITAGTPQEQAKQINDYLIQFKERLEFVLMNISVENLSKELREKLSSLGTDIKNSNEEMGDQMQQVAKKTISVSDVINSEMFKSALKAVSDTIPTEYVKSVVAEESTEDAGIDIFTIKDSKGKVSEYGVKNEKPLVFSINFDTGNLEYE